MFLINYVLGKPKKTIKLLEPKAEAATVVRPVKIKKNKMYLVIDKNSGQHLGIFDNLEEAKKDGQKFTHNNCSIYIYRINGNCKYLNTPVFEDK
jgi:hypothetical protein